MVLSSDVLTLIDQGAESCSTTKKKQGTRVSNLQTKKQFVKQVLECVK